MDDPQIRQVLEAAIFAADTPLDRDAMLALFDPGELDKPALAKQLEALAQDYENRGLELKEVASGFRFQVRRELGPWVSRLWQEKPQRYSRAILETLALIAYRQPITRGEIEEIRGVAVSTQIVKTLLERNWVRVVGHRDVPGRPALYATTRQFLDYFDLTSLDQLPPLAEIRDLDEINRELQLEQGPAADAALEMQQAAQEPSQPDAPDAEPSGWDHIAEQEDLAKVDAILADFDSRFRRDKKSAAEADTNSSEPDASAPTVMTNEAVEPDDE
jgi:segregation and condensation protein B